MAALLTPGWVYNFSDYQRMYDLSADDLQKKILDFPGVFGSFNAEATARGLDVSSAGAIYQLQNDTFVECVNQFLERHMSYLQAHTERLQDPASLEDIFSAWRHAQSLLLSDYPAGKAAGRYIPVDLTDVSFATHEYELILCSHLFFHRRLPESVSPIALLRMLCNAAQEVRLYPLLDENGDIAAELGPLMHALQQENYGVEVRQVAYDSQKGANAMLRIWAQACVVGSV